MIVEKYAADYIETYSMGQGDIHRYKTFNTPEEALEWLEALTSKEMTLPTFGFKSDEKGYMIPDDEEAYLKWCEINPNWQWNKYSRKFSEVGNLRPIYVHKIYVKQ